MNGLDGDDTIDIDVVVGLTKVRTLNLKNTYTLQKPHLPHILWKFRICGDRTERDFGISTVCHTRIFLKKAPLLPSN